MMKKELRRTAKSVIKDNIILL